MIKLDDMVFVFGSNLAGVHGSGAAAHARKHRRFPLHLGVGPAMHCYAIPTKDCAIETLPHEIIKLYIDQFMDYAALMEGADMQFQVTRIGCGLAGYRDEDIAPLFISATRNCWFDEAWKPWLLEHNFWGTA
jgi:hypothetical protein